MSDSNIPNFEELVAANGTSKIHPYLSNDEYLTPEQEWHVRLDHRDKGTFEGYLGLYVTIVGTEKKSRILVPIDGRVARSIKGGEVNFLGDRGPDNMFNGVKLGDEFHITTQHGIGLNYVVESAYFDPNTEFGYTQS